MNAESPYLKEFLEGDVAGSTEFRQYSKVIEGSSKRRSPDFPEKHHVVPREWLKLNIPGFTERTEDRGNVVWLSVEGKLLAMQLTAAILLLKRDSRSYASVIASMSRRYGFERGELWKNPYFGKDVFDRKVRLRECALSGRKLKYSDGYLEECLKTWNSTDDKDAAFAEIRDRLGFGHTKTALLYNLRKRFGRDSA